MRERCWPAPLPSERFSARSRPDSESVSIAPAAASVTNNDKANEALSNNFLIFKSLRSHVINDGGGIESLTLSHLTALSSFAGAGIDLV